MLPSAQTPKAVPLSSRRRKEGKKMTRKIEIVCSKCQNTIAEIELYEASGIKDLIGIDSEANYNQALEEITIESLLCSKCLQDQGGKEYARAYEAGFDNGYEDGRSVGYDEGFDAREESTE